MTINPNQPAWQDEERSGPAKDALAAGRHMSRHMSRHQKLLVAISLISEVRVTMNTQRWDCDSCGCNVFDDFAEANAHKALDGAIGRLRRVGDVLEILASEGGER